MQEADFWDKLGLQFVREPKTVELANGVLLTYLPPTSVETTQARHTASSLFEANDRLVRAAQRYGWSAEDVRTAIRPDSWEGVAQLAFAIELACLIVSAIDRAERSVAPDVTAFRHLFRVEANLVTFLDAITDAQRDLIRAKKEPPPSPDGSGPGAAKSAPDASGSNDPAPAAVSDPKTDSPAQEG